VLSPEKRTALAARAWAELGLRLARARRREIEWSGKPLFWEACRPIFRTDGPIDLGADCRLRGGPTRTRFITRGGGRIELGDGVGMNYGCEITAEHLVKIGDATGFGPLVVIFDSSFHPLGEGEEVKSGPVVIGANVWVGRHALILPGVTVGDHAVIAAGSVVARDVPPRTVVAGNPAKPLREIQAADDWRRI
jgi:acetyltransferase-like isoleucine patch superfamily enzyme